MQANPQIEQRLTELNGIIYDLNRTLENPNLSEEDRSEYASQLRDAEYDRSEIIFGEDFSLMKIDLDSLIDRMILEGIHGTLNWIIEKKRQDGNPEQYQDDALWVMDVLPEGDKTAKLTFEQCCEMRGMNTQNIKHCLYIMSRRELQEVCEFKDHFHVIEKREIKFDSYTNSGVTVRGSGHAIAPLRSA